MALVKEDDEPYSVEEGADKITLLNMRMYDDDEVSLYDDEEEGTSKRTLKHITFEQKVKAVTMYQEHRSIDYMGKIKHDCRWAGQYSDTTLQQLLIRWEKQIKDGGSRLEKLQKIHTYVAEKFDKASNEGFIIHDIMLRKWAKEKSDEVKLKNFKAGHHWALNFKSRVGISERLINKFVTRKQLKDKDNIEARVQNFREKAREELKEFDDFQVFNMDQSGFNLEHHSRRTLAYTGTKKVIAVADSISALTHSYTICPLISKKRLLSPLPLIMKEEGLNDNGEYGPIVQKKLFRPENILLVPNSSGKMGKNELKRWFKDGLLPNVETKAMVLWDALSTHNQKNLQDLDWHNKDISFLSIPDGLTAYVQPLDTYGFRPWKNIDRKLSDALVLEDVLPDNINTRNNIIKKMSLIHNHLCAPQYYSMWEYSWYSAGLTDEEPERFPNPYTFMFNVGREKCRACSEEGYIRCAWCKDVLCLSHYFVEYHFCNNVT